MLFVRPSEGGVSTNMTVITSARFYEFDLVPANGAPPYEVRFRYPNEPTVDATNMPGQLGDPDGNYRLDGPTGLRPAGLTNACVKTDLDRSPENPATRVFFHAAYRRHI